MLIKIELPKDVRFIINEVKKAGYEAYAVGGCIRDSLLKKTPGDYDITTSASPREIKKIFRRTIDTGIEHGTVTVMLGKTGYEVTTYRIDGKYEDSRHPSKVTFTRSLEEDLKRRDFTINAMAYNDEDGLVDLFGGREDMEKRIIRCVGNPLERFSEDALRMMRAVRFAAQLGYSIEEETLYAMKELSRKLDMISEERIRTELVKLLVSPHPEVLRTAYECGLTAVFMPEFDDIMHCEQYNPHHLYSVGEHTIRVICKIENTAPLRLAALFHDFGKPATRTTDEEGIDHFHGHPEISRELCHGIMRRLKFDNTTTDIVCRLVKYHDYKVNRDKKSVRKALNEVGEDLFLSVLELKRADTLGQSEYKREQKLADLDELTEIYHEIIKDGDCISLKDLAVTGSDLIKEGYRPGPGLGEELQSLLQTVLDEPSFNQKDILLQLAKKHLAERMC